MTPDQRKKLLDIRIRSKMGKITKEEQAFCQEMFDKFPDEYPKDSEIFEIVKQLINPFGQENTMSFMEKQVVYGLWVLVETNHGTEVIDMDLVDTHGAAKESSKLFAKGESILAKDSVLRDFL